MNDMGEPQIKISLFLLRLLCRMSLCINFRMQPPWILERSIAATRLEKYVFLKSCFKRIILWISTKYSTGCSVDERQVFPYMETGNIIITITILENDTTLFNKEGHFGRNISFTQPNCWHICLQWSVIALPSFHRS